MISQRIANLFFAIIFLGVIGYLAWIAWGFQIDPFADFGFMSKAVPLALLGAIALCVVIYAFEYLTKGESGEDGRELFFESIFGFVRTLLLIAVILAAYLIWRQKGLAFPNAWLGIEGGGDLVRVPAFVVAGLLLPVGAALAMGNRNLVQLGAIVVSTILIFLAFRFGLNVRFG